MASVAVSSRICLSLSVFASGFLSVGRAPSAFTKTGSARPTIGAPVVGFARVAVLIKAGKIVSLSNPIWLRRETPPWGVLAARAA